MATENVSGFLLIQATTASGALPVQNAVVIVAVQQPDNTAGPILYRTETDISGRTPLLTLPTVPKNDAPPYVEYRVRVSAPKYHSVLYEGVPIFEDITTNQPVTLIPLEEDALDTAPITFPPYKNTLDR